MYIDVVIQFEIFTDCQTMFVHKEFGGVKYAVAVSVSVSSVTPGAFWACSNKG